MADDSADVELEDEVSSLPLPPLLSAETAPCSRRGRGDKRGAKLTHPRPAPSSPQDALLETDIVAPRPKAEACAPTRKPCANCSCG